jgi:transcriptional regulator with GAF, ATPase, and Fis domain
MVGKKPGRFTLKAERELIAMAASGATVSKAAAKLGTTAKTIERKAMALGVQFSSRGAEARSA